MPPFTPLLVSNSSRLYTFIQRVFTPVFTLNEYLSSKSIKTITLCDNERLIAVSLYIVRESEICCAYTLVEPHYRNRGCNSALKKFVESECKRLRIPSLIAHVRAANRISHHSLLSLGYSEDKSVELFYPDGEEKIRMRKAL